MVTDTGAGAGVDASTVPVTVLDIPPRPLLGGVTAAAALLLEVSIAPTLPIRELKDNSLIGFGTAAAAVCFDPPNIAPSSSDHQAPRHHAKPT